MLHRDLETQHLHAFIFQHSVIHHLGCIFSYILKKYMYLNGIKLKDTFILQDQKIP